MRRGVKMGRSSRGKRDGKRRVEPRIVRLMPRRELRYITTYVDLEPAPASITAACSQLPIFLCICLVDHKPLHHEPIFGTIILVFITHWRSNETSLKEIHVLHLLFILPIESDNRSCHNSIFRMAEMTLHVWALSRDCLTMALERRTSMLPGY